MKKLNCWEYKKCGREPGGKHVALLGVCPAARSTKANGLNGGKYAGRICWAIAGTFCGGEIIGTFAETLPTCLGCDFFHLVRSEEGENFCLMFPGQVYKQPKMKKSIKKTK